jgi:nucleoside-triphosphatase
MQNFLLRGIPGVGKTTVVEKLVEKLRDLNTIGFYTKEIREKGNRVGFSLIGLDGRKSILSHIRHTSSYQVGRYKVDLGGFERFLDELNLLDSLFPIVMIDEIGKMECFSKKFQEIVIQLLDGQKIVMATIAEKGGGFSAKIRKREDCHSIRITRQNRDILPTELEEMVRLLI